MLKSIINIDIWLFTVTRAKKLSTGGGVNKILLCCIVVLSCLTGCAHQEIAKFHQKPVQICIAKNRAVKGTFLSTLQQGFEANNTKTRIIDALYLGEENEYTPEIDKDELEDCDAIAFYVAHWNWDIGWYLI